RHENVARFERRVRQAELAQQLRASDLEPHEVVRVVDDPHLVGLGIARSEAESVLAHPADTSRTSAFVASLAPESFPAPKTAEPATNQSAPAATRSRAFDDPIPPSTSIFTASPAALIRARSSRTLWSARGMKLCPP